MEKSELNFNFKRAWGPIPKYPRVEKYERPKNHNEIIVAGPCSVESPEQIHTIAEELSKYKVKFLRGGVFRAGTYPGGKFGIVDESLMHEFNRAARQNGMQCVMEVLDYHPEVFKLYAKYADCYQIGARAMQNYTLLRWIGKQKRTVSQSRSSFN